MSKCTTIFFSLTCFALVMVSYTQDCKTFNNLFGNRWPNKHRCTPNCLEDGSIEGTTIYSPESYICPAAVHAGVINPNEKKNQEVQFKRVTSNTKITGSIRNRRVSQSAWKHGGFRFTSKKYVSPLNEESWMTDVYLVHNSYNASFTAYGESREGLWLACLWDSYSSEIPLEIFRWNNIMFYDGRSTVNKDHNKKRVEVITTSFNNLRVFNCNGKHTHSDVMGIINRQFDKYVAENISNVKSLGEDLIVKMRYYETPHVNLHHFPDDWNNTNLRVPLEFEKLKELDNGLYTAGDFDHSDRESISAYFEIIVKECPDNMYGDSCAKNCKPCHNGGVCHPVFGSCVCRAGFYGTRCEKRCPLDSFGSNCQFSCSREHLGQSFSYDKKNCLGLTFCLPKPLGCSCAFGYEGFLCNEFSNLTFPYFNRSPSVKLKSGSLIEIEFEEWKAEVDSGDTFGLKILNYEIMIGNSLSTKVNHPTEKAQVNIEDEKYYEIKVQINLQYFSETQRPLPKFSPINIVSLPCFVISEKRRISVMKQEEKTLEFLWQIPTKQIGFKGCLFTLTSRSEYQTNPNPIECKNITQSSKVLCQFEDLPSGTEFEVEVSCENKIGRCSPEKISTFTLPNIDGFVDYSDLELTVKKFAKFDQMETEINVMKLQNFAEEKNLQTLQPQEILRIPSIVIATKGELIWNEEAQVYSLSFEEKIENSDVFNFVILLQMKNQNKDIHTSVSRVFVSSASSDTIKYISISLIVITILLLILMVIFIRKRMLKTKLFKNPFVKKSSSFPELNISAPSVVPKKTGFYDDSKKTDKDASSCYTNDEVILSGHAGENAKSVSFRNAKPNDVFNHEIKNDDLPDYENFRNSSTFDEGFEIYLNSLINSPKTVEAFYSIPKDCGKPCTVATHPINKSKNRYRNNLPYDDTRVVLPVVGNDPYSDYINASLMNGINNKKWYISTQGPKDSNQNTLGDFWRMVVEARIDFIIMVANFYEKGKLKVGEYFREGEVLDFNGIYVSVQERVQRPHFIRSIIQVTYNTPEMQAIAKDIVHYQFIKWPDHGVPTQIFPLVFMVQSILQEYKEGGITIHCSAGIGRTGTILLVLLLKEYQEVSTWIDPLSVLRNMRESRAGLVENIHQFNLSLLLLYECLYGKIGSVYASEIDSNKNKYFMDSGILFERLMKQPILHTYTFGESNIDLNRNPEILPSDNHVIFFGNEGTEKNSDYLNAISIDIEDMLNSLIVTEHPLSSTLYNFWKMIFANQCSYLCLLNCIEPSEDFPSILPLEEGFADFGDLALHVASIDNSFHFPSSHYKVTLSSRESSHTLNVVQLLEWTPEEEYPASLSQLESLATFVKDKANSKAPVVICCSDGVTACGILTAAVNVINRIDVYQELNIYNSVLRIRRCRPEFLTSKNQFMKLYEVASLYIENNASYQNFQ